MNFEYKDTISGFGNNRQITFQNSSQSKTFDENDSFLLADVNFEIYDLMFQFLQELKYNDLTSILRSVRIFCTRSQISQFPQNYDFISFLDNCIAIKAQEKIQFETLKLLEVLFIQPLFIEYFNNSISNINLLSRLSSFLLEHVKPDFDILILRDFINLSGGTANERDLALNFLNFENLFEILESNEIDQTVKHYAARLIHNYCRQSINVALGIHVMEKYAQVWHMNIPPDAKTELNWAIKNLRPSLKIDWIKAIKRNKMIPLFLEGCVYDNQCLTISSFYIIFQLIDDQETVEINFKFIKDLLSDMNNSDNLSIGCWCVQHLIKFERLKASIAKQFIEFGIIAQVLYVFQTAQFECKVDAMFALCAFAKSDLTEFFDIFFQNDFITNFLEFFSSPIKYELKVKMVSALIVIFDKAVKKGLIKVAKQEFIENGGNELFDEFINDENDEDGKLANKASLFLSLYIDDE